MRRWTAATGLSEAAFAAFAALRWGAGTGMAGAVSAASAAGRASGFMSGFVSGLAAALLTQLPILTVRAWSPTLSEPTQSAGR
jgi:hypothetical protein